MGSSMRDWLVRGISIVGIVAGLVVFNDGLFASFSALAADGEVRSAGSASATPTPPKFPDLVGHVVDQTETIPADEKAAIDSRLASLERETGEKFVVVTVSAA